jgi:hypothetical protein
VNELKIPCYTPANGTTVTMAPSSSIPIDISTSLIKRAMRTGHTGARQTTSLADSLLHDQSSSTGEYDHDQATNANTTTTTTMSVKRDHMAMAHDDAAKAEARLASIVKTEIDATSAATATTLMNASLLSSLPSRKRTVKSEPTTSSFTDGTNDSKRETPSSPLSPSSPTMKRARLQTTDDIKAKQGGISHDDIDTGATATTDVVVPRQSVEVDGVLLSTRQGVRLVELEEAFRETGNHYHHCARLHFNC